MLSAERVSRILDILEEKGVVRVDDLARDFNVSEMTIRRDLEKCEKEGLVRRCYGGAVLKKVLRPIEMRYLEKSGVCIEEKKRIAKRCAEIVTEGDIIYLDAGTTTMEIAKEIADMKDIAIITNDLHIACYLINNDLRLIVVGGDAEKHIGGIYGSMAIQMIENIRIDKSFLATMAIDNKYDVFTSNFDKAAFRYKVMENSNETYLAVDSTKFKKQGFVKVNNLNEFTGVITDKTFSALEHKCLKDKMINMISV